MLERYFDRLSKKDLLRILLFSYVILFVWSMVVNYIDLKALRNDGITPGFIEYWSEMITYQVLTSPIIIFVITGIIPSILVMFSRSKSNVKSAKILWYLFILAIGILAIANKYQFHLARGSFGI
jgi:membrane protease YdiL (CAAX protease family)